MKRAPLYEQLKLYIRQLIIDNANVPNYRLPSEANLLQTFNVSRITAKRTLNDLETEGLVIRKKGKGTYINPALTKETLDTLATQSNYPKIYSEKSHTMSVIVPDITSRYYINILYGILDKAEEHNWLVQVANTNVNLEKEMETIKKMRFYSHGMIMFPLNYNTYAKEIIRLSFKNYPLAFIDNYLQNANIPCILSDNFDAIYKATEKLIKSGRKNVAYVSFPENAEISLEERIRGYKQALTDNGLPIREELIYHTGSHVEIMVENKLRDFLKSTTADAIITANCGLGIKAAKELSSLGKNKLLKNLIIFDDEFDRLTDLLKFNVRFIRQDAYKIGQTAAELIIQQFNEPSNLLKQTLFTIPTEPHY